MGVDIAPQTDPQEDIGGFEVFHENWDIVCAFLACETQWNVAAGLAGLIWLGLDYSGVKVALSHLKLDGIDFGLLQEMERAAIEELSEAGS